MGFMVQQVGSIPAISHNIKIGKNMLKEGFEELIKREVNENQYKNIYSGIRGFAGVYG